MKKLGTCIHATMAAYDCRYFSHFGIAARNIVGCIKDECSDENTELLRKLCYYFAKSREYDMSCAVAKRIIDTCKEGDKPSSTGESNLFSVHWLDRFLYALLLFKTDRVGIAKRIIYTIVSDIHSFKDSPREITPETYDEYCQDSHEFQLQSICSYLFLSVLLGENQTECIKFLKFIENEEIYRNKVAHSVKEMTKKRAQQWRKDDVTSSPTVPNSMVRYISSHDDKSLDLEYLSNPLIISLIIRSFELIYSFGLPLLVLRLIPLSDWIFASISHYNPTELKSNTSLIGMERQILWIKSLSWCECSRLEPRMEQRESPDMKRLSDSAVHLAWSSFLPFLPAFLSLSMLPASPLYPSHALSHLLSHPSLSFLRSDASASASASSSSPPDDSLPHLVLLGEHLCECGWTICGLDVLTYAEGVRKRIEENPIDSDKQSLKSTTRGTHSLSKKTGTGDMSFTVHSLAAVGVSKSDSDISTNEFDLLSLMESQETKSSLSLAFLLAYYELRCSIEFLLGYSHTHSLLTSENPFFPFMKKSKKRKRLSKGDNKERSPGSSREDPPLTDRDDERGMSARDGLFSTPRGLKEATDASKTSPMRSVSSLSRSRVFLSHNQSNIGVSVLKQQILRDKLVISSHTSPMSFAEISRARREVLGKEGTSNRVYAQTSTTAATYSKRCIKEMEDLHSKRMRALSTRGCDSFEETIARRYGVREGDSIPPIVLSMCGLSLALTGEEEESDIFINKAISMSPLSPFPWLCLSLAHLARGCVDAAYTATSIVMKVDVFVNVHWSVLCDVGAILYLCGRMKECLDVLVEARERARKEFRSGGGIRWVSVFVQLHLLLSDVYSDLGLVQEESDVINELYEYITINNHLFKPNIQGEMEERLVRLKLML
ncbi:hypothetical protein ADUPG1_012609 [Aduncisulcus paluster]|uniref:Uncharacterized protein n=1 Tax=Aduncisulcus paluster TaxID=2918883 RepID=A0ABQ5K010_9EUKA|nr:hypothetical protein ADUPG1_012609 [Aduncisulcus paluster]